jgi:PAS domain S-box-containing protein
MEIMTAEYAVKNPIRLLPVLILLIAMAIVFVIATLVEAQPSIEITAEERNWLDHNPEKLTILFNTEFPPIEFISDSGDFVGMGADIINMVEKRLGITFLKRPSKDWNAHLAALESGECAIAPTIVHTVDRDRYAFFTTAYATVPVVIITARSFSGKLTLDDLDDRRVGVVSGYATEQYLRDRSLDRFEVVSVQNVSGGLRSVAFGQLDAFVENLAVAAYTITQEGLPNLRVAGRTDYAFAWRIGISRKYPLLYSSIQKAMNGIPETELEVVRKHWIALEDHIGMDPETLQALKIITLFVLLLLLSLSCITFFLKRRLNEKVVGLRESERKYRELVENANSIILRMDTRCRVTFFNEFAQHFFGFREDEILGRNVVGSIVLPTDSSGQDMVAIMDRIALDTAAYPNYENENIRRNGELVWIAWTNKAVFDETGSSREILCIGNDITERKRNEEERTLLATVIEQAEENVLITDQRRTIIYVNPAFERSSGYRCEEIKGQKLKMLRSDQHDEDFYQTAKEILDRGEVWTGAIVNKGKGGANFEIEGTISPIRNTSGAITHFVAVGRNMNRFRRMERELHQAQKLDALGTLAGGIAHDFNNVLTAIMGLIEMESLGARDGSQSHDRMAQALSACCRARDLIKQILAFSRHSDQQRKPIEMGSIMEDAVKMLRATIPTTIDIQFTLQDVESVILGDSTQIHQVIVNLCTNAAHAMRDTGGILKISLDHVEIDALKAAEHLDMQPGMYVRTVVGDTGHGMDRKTLNRIFEPFFTTKGPGEGAGIGLAVVHGIVKNHGGRIAVYSETGKGSTFELFFPRMETTLTSVDKPKAELPTGTGRILLVDDEKMLIDVITEMLKILGYEVVSANRSLDALQLFQSQCDRFDLVITDFTMPEMTGMELAAELLRIRCDIPIILSTGFTSAEIRETAKTMGIGEVMMKPFILQELAETVRRILDRHISDVNKLKQEEHA